MSDKATRLNADLDAKVECFADFHLWPVRQRLDPYAWMKNFGDTDRPYALVLLNAFTYYNDDLVDALFRATVQGLSAERTHSVASLAEAKFRWREFLATVVVTYVEGEKPSPTDSGFVFARKARQELGIEEAQIMRPSDALRVLAARPTSPLLLVDDFVGGGNQMRTTWTRQYEVGSGMTHSFSQAAANGASITYAPLVATTHGLSNLQAYCPELVVRPGYVLDERYSLVHPKSMFWPKALQPTALDWMESTSKRARIIDEYEYSWRGFHELGLALGFDRSVPDATLPLFFWEGGSWAPLIRRT